MKLKKKIAVCALALCAVPFAASAELSKAEWQCKMFGNPPVVVLRPSDHMIDYPAGTLSVDFVSRNIRYSEKSFNCMHVGIKTPVRITNGKFRVPGIAG